MNLEVMVRERVVYSAEVESVVLPAVEGEMGVLAGHADFIVMLKKGPLRIRSRTGTQAISVDGGYAEVSGDKVVVLPDAVTD